MKIRFIADKPIENYAEDLLGFREFACLIKSSIEQTQTPFVYGILGDWGSGKTSLLRLVENLFNNDFENGSTPFVPIWFNAWQYENENNIIYPLLHAVKKDYENRIGLYDDGEFKRSFKKVVTSSFLTITDLAFRTITKHFTDTPLTLNDIKEKLSEVEDWYAEKPKNNVLTEISNCWADQVANFQETFERLIDCYGSEIANGYDNYEQDKIRFVFLIDDLDQCLPDNAISLIENIKNHLTVKMLGPDLDAPSWLEPITGLSGLAAYVALVALGVAVFRLPLPTWTGIALIVGAVLAFVTFLPLFVFFGTFVGGVGMLRWDTKAAASAGFSAPSGHSC